MASWKCSSLTVARFRECFSYRLARSVWVLTASPPVTRANQHRFRAPRHIGDPQRSEPLRRPSGPGPGASARVSGGWTHSTGRPPARRTRRLPSSVSSRADGDPTSAGRRETRFATSRGVAWNFPRKLAPLRRHVSNSLSQPSDRVQTPFRGVAQFCGSCLVRLRPPPGAGGTNSRARSPAVRPT